MLAAENWCVKVDEKVYGPYTSEQLRKFASEGRLAAWSLIAPAGSRAWREANTESIFSSVFGVSDIKLKKTGAPRAFGKRDDTDSNNTQGQAAAGDSKVANFVIIFDVVNAAASRVEAAIMSLGPAFMITENVWSVTCELTAIGVRNVIAPYLNPKESIFVVDTTRGRSSWQNFSPEKHAKISAAYLTMRAKERVNAR